MISFNKICEKIKFINKDKTFKYVVILLLILYSLSLLIIYCITKAKVPDEIWFLNLVKKLSFNNYKEVLFMQNYLGYGALYWIFLYTVKKIIWLRLIAWVCIVLAPVSVIFIQKKLFDFPLKYILLSVILYLSFPCAWFTGKIIGPELYSNMLAIAGCVLALYVYTKKVRLSYILYLLAGILLGLSVGIKLYNITFCLFIGSYILLSDLKNKINFLNTFKKAIITSVGAITGFILSNLIILTSVSTFIFNLKKYSTPFNIKYFSNVIFKKYIEWDLLSSGGLNHFIIPFYILLVIFILSFILHKNKIMPVSIFISTLFLIIMCSRSRFLGWYLMPLTFFLPLLITPPPPRSQQHTSQNNFNKICNYILIITVLLNALIMSPKVYAQLSTKIKTMINIKNQEKYIAVTKKYNEIYKDYKPVYVLDMGLKSLPYMHFLPPRFNGKKKAIVYFSEHAKDHKMHGNIIKASMTPNNQYKFVTKEDGVTVVLFTPQKNN